MESVLVPGRFLGLASRSFTKSRIGFVLTGVNREVLSNIDGTASHAWSRPYKDESQFDICDQVLEEIGQRNSFSFGDLVASAQRSISAISKSYVFLK